MRVRPVAWIGIVVWLVYAAIVVTVQGTSGIEYTEFGDTPSNMWRGPVLSLAIGAVAIAVIAAALGWWGAAMRDRVKSGPKWTLVAPILYAILAVAVLLTADFGNISTEFILAAIALGVLVGFSEEFLCRGLLLVGLRGNVREVWVWLFTCLLFGVMHGLNVVLGAPVGETVSQIVLAAMQGSTFYLLRRVTGSLVWAMLLHGFWDFAIFMNQTSGVELAVALNLAQFPIVILSFIGGLLVALRTDRDRLYEDYAVGARGTQPLAQPA